MKKSHVLFSFAMLTVLLTAGAAQSLSGSNTVFSDDIVDGTILYADLKDGSLGGKKILDTSVTESKLANGSVSNRTIQSDAVNSSKVDDDSIVLSTDTNMGKGSDTLNFPSIPANTCSASLTLASGNFTFREDDAIAATADPDDWPTGLTFYTVNDSSGTLPGTSSFGVVACNVTGSSIDAPATEFDWAQLP